ncbi:MAG: ADOP family duplicated permease [Gemmatimonadota bacterium]
MSRFERAALRLYGGLLGLFPRGFRDEEAGAALDTLREMVRGEPARSRRSATLFRALRRLPGALVLEWWAALRGGDGRTPTDGPSRGRGVFRWGWMEGMKRNVGHTLRALRRNPGFGVTAGVLVALGVGAVTTVFTLVDHVLLRPLPYPDPHEIVLVKPGYSHSVPAFRDFRETGIASEWAAVMRGEVTVMRGDEPRAMYEGRVSPDFFEIFGARAATGRLLDVSDLPDAGTVVLAWEAWQREWGGDPDILGKTIRVDDRPLTVVGVLDRSFFWPEGLQLDQKPDLWRPLDFTFPELQNFAGPNVGTERGWSLFSVVGRLAPGVTLEAAQAEFDALARRRAEEWPEHYVYNDAPVSLPLVPLQEAMVEDARQGLGLLFGAVGLLLLVACANVAHLFLARGLERMHEMALRRALGAGRAALAGQLLVESLVVGLLGGLAGVGLARGALAGFRRWGPTDLPRLDAVALDLRVMAFAVALSAATAVVFGMLPALQAIRRDPGDAIRGDGPGITTGRASKLVRSGLVIAEVALSVVLVASAGLLLRSYTTLTAVESGVETADVWTIPLTRIAPEDGEDWYRMGDAITNAVAAVPGVRSATFGVTMPLEFFGGSGVWFRWSVRTPETSDDPVPVVMHWMSPTYFTTLGIELLAGDGWSAADRGTEPVPVVLSAELARQLFGRTEGVVGRIVERRTDQGPVRLVVRGVAPDVRHWGLARTEPIAELYAPAWMMSSALPRLSVAAKLAPGAGSETVGALREAVWSVEPGMPVPIVRPLDEWVARSTAGSRFQSMMLWAFGAVALLLAAGGLYGTLLYSVRQRRRELGLRMALGAPPRLVHGMVLRQGLVLGGVGAALGVGGALWASRLLESRLFGIEPTDPLALGLTAGVLLATVVLASWVPALQAARTDPVRQLSAE